LKGKKRKGKIRKKRKKETTKFMLFSDHNGSLLRRQPEAMTIGHSPKGKEAYQLPEAGRAGLVLSHV